MNGTMEQPKPVQEEILIRIHFDDGGSFVQPLPLDDLEGAQSFMDWYRSRTGCPVWSWKVTSSRMIHMLDRRHIIAVDIEGYIEPEGRESKWYERMIDKLRTIIRVRR